MPPATGPDQFGTMLQGLLAERLGLVVHHESRNLPVYLLTPAKGGSKLESRLQGLGEDAGDHTAAGGEHTSRLAWTVARSCRRDSMAGTHTPTLRGWNATVTETIRCPN